MAKSLVGNESGDLGCCDDLVLAGYYVVGAQSIIKSSKALFYHLSHSVKDLRSQPVRDSAEGLVTLAIPCADHEYSSLRIDIALAKILVGCKEHLADVG